MALRVSREPHSRFNSRTERYEVTMTDGKLEPVGQTPGMAIANFGDRKLSVSATVKKCEWTCQGHRSECL